MSDLCRRRYIGVCRGGVSVTDVCRRSYIGVCRRSVCVTDLCRRSYIGICRGSVRVTYKSVKYECPTKVSNKSVK